MKGSGLVRPDPSFVSALPIFPVRLQTSIVGTGELNFRVRNGNGWTLALISTNLLSFEKESMQRKLYLHTSCALLSHSQSESVIYFFTPSKLNNPTHKLSFEVT